MDAIIGPNTVSLGAADTAPLTGTPGYATNGNPGVTSPTPFPAYHYNGLIQELLALIAGAGITQTSYTLTQLLQAVKRIGGGNATAVAASQALTADNAGLVQINAASGNIVLTLPLANSAGGRPIYFDFVRTDSSANSVTVQDAGGDVDLPGSASSISVTPGNPVSLIGNGVNQWLVMLNGAASLFSTILAKSSAYTIQPSDNGSYISAGASITVTLPLTSGISAGFRVAIANNAGGSVTTINPNGANVALSSGLGTANFTLPNSSDFVLLEWDGTYWRVFGGSAALLGALKSSNNLSDVASLATALTNLGFSNSLGTSGYQKLPGGLILQWGKTSNFSSETSQGVTFPIAFPNACLNAGTTLIIPAGTGNYDQFTQIIGTPSTTGMSIMCQQVTNYTYPVSAFWFALGN